MEFAVWIAVCCVSLLLSTLHYRVIGSQQSCMFFEFPLDHSGVLTISENTDLNLTFVLNTSNCDYQQDFLINLSREPPLSLQCFIKQNGSTCTTSGNTTMCGCTSRAMTYTFSKRVSKSDNLTWIWSVLNGKKIVTGYNITFNVTENLNSSQEARTPTPDVFVMTMVSVFVGCVACCATVVGIIIYVMDTKHHKERGMFFEFPLDHSGVLTISENTDLNLTFVLNTSNCDYQQDFLISLSREPPLSLQCFIKQNGSTCMISRNTAMCGCTSRAMTYTFSKRVSKSDNLTWIWSVLNGTKIVAGYNITFNVTENLNSSQETRTTRPDVFVMTMVSVFAGCVACCATVVGIIIYVMDTKHHKERAAYISGQARNLATGVLRLINRSSRSTGVRSFNPYSDTVRTVRWSTTGRWSSLDTSS